MSEQDISMLLERLEQKVDSIYKSVEKTRKYFLWTLIITLVLLILPLFFLPFAFNSLLSSYSSALNF